MGPIKSQIGKRGGNNRSLYDAFGLLVNYDSHTLNLRKKTTALDKYFLRKQQHMINTNGKR